MASIGSSFNSLNTGSVIIQRALGTILDIVRVILRAGVGSVELRLFFADLMVHSVIIGSDLERIARAGFGLAPELIESIAIRLGAVITTDSSSERRLQEFHTRWNDVRTKDSLAKSQFIDSALDFGKTHDQRMSFIEFLATWENEVEARYPEDQSWTTEDFTPQKKVVDPPLSVGKAAQAAFKTLVSCQNCVCKPEHDFGARLCLGTYRKSNIDADVGDVDFNLFLSMKHDWQEVCVHTVKENAIQFDLPGQTTLPKPRELAAPVKELCKPIGKAPKNMRVELKVMRGRLFKLRSLPRTHVFDFTKDAVSLEHFLHSGPRAFTDKTKRILAVLLSYTVLHLQDTPWLQSTWNSSDIIFFRTKASEVPLRPFLKARLSQVDKLVPQSDEWSEDGFDPDEWPQHQCPSLVTLAIILMEVYFVTPFDVLAKRLDVEIGDDMSCFRYLDASMVFSACRHEIPENVQFLYAVEKCLDTATWEDENGNRLDSQVLKAKIYQEVVQPLESDFSLAYSTISIDELDQFAQTLDFSSWDQAIRNPQTNNQDDWSNSSEQRLSPLGSLPSHYREYTSPSGSTHSSPPIAPRSRQHLGVERLDKYLHPQLVSGVYQAPMQDLTSEADYKALRFFDDELGTGAHSPDACARYSHWKGRYKSVYEKFISPYLRSGVSAPHVKVAIIDTGIDLNHPDIQAFADNIKAKHNWLRDSTKATVNDINGHGTFVAGLAFDYAPDAEIYIAEVADRKPPSPSVIAKAIRHAVDIWKVDIISMSFGYPTRNIEDYDDMDHAIKHAYFHDVLLFAAASNSGGQLGRAYPAREANVVCVHSTDVHGNRSPFSPTAIPEDINLATVGQAVESACSTHLYSSEDYGATEEGADETYSTIKSGTSYSTPIMAGIAAFLLLYARIHLPKAAHRLRDRSRMVSLLQRIAQKVQGGGPRDGYYFVDMSLFGDSLFGKDKPYIDQTIMDILNG